MSAITILCFVQLNVPILDMHRRMVKGAEFTQSLTGFNGKQEEEANQLPLGADNLAVFIAKGIREAIYLIL